MSFHHSPKIVSNGLVLCLDAANTKSYPGSGTTWSDLSGNGNTGTLTNGPTFNSGNNGSIVFDGVNDSIEVDHTTLLNPTLNMTISVWANLQALPTLSTDVAPLCGKGTSTSGQGGYDFRIDGPAVGSIYRINLVKYFIVDQHVNLPELFVDTWYNFTAVQSSNQVTYFVNGTSIGSFSNSSNYQTNTTNFGIGVDRISAFFLNGNIAFTSFYNRVLTSVEVLQNYNATKGRFGL